MIAMYTLITSLIYVPLKHEDAAVSLAVNTGLGSADAEPGRLEGQRLATAANAISFP